MLRTMLKSKLHGAAVTQTELHYAGSITIARDLMEAADLLDGEQVQIVNLNNGERIVTYVIEGPAGSGVICLNGPAARRAQVGDSVHILSYCQVTEDEAQAWRAHVVVLGEGNRIVETP